MSQKLKMPKADLLMELQAQIKKGEALLAFDVESPASMDHALEEMERARSQWNHYNRVLLERAYEARDVMVGYCQSEMRRKAVGQDSFEKHSSIKKAIESSLSYLRGKSEQMPLYIDPASEGGVRDVSITREGIFFKGQRFDALMQVSGILKAAAKSIDLIDGYIDESILNLLAIKAAGVQVRVLTSPLGAPLKPLASAFNKQYGGLAIRSSADYHDRFVFVDGAEIFHFGASLKDAGAKGFMFSRIEEPSMLAALRAQFEKDWQTAKVEV